MRAGNELHSVKAKQFARDLQDDFLSLKRGLEQKKITFYCLISCNKASCIRFFQLKRTKNINFLYNVVNVTRAVIGCCP